MAISQSKLEGLKETLFLGDLGECDPLEPRPSSLTTVFFVKLTHDLKAMQPIK